MTGVNLKTVHEINLIQNGGGERQEFRRSHRRSESFFGEMRVPLKEEKSKANLIFILTHKLSIVLRDTICGRVEGVCTCRVSCFATKLVVMMRSSIFILSDMSRAINAYSVLFVIH